MSITGKAVNQGTYPSSNRLLLRNIDVVCRAHVFNFLERNSATLSAKIVVCSEVEPPSLLRVHAINGAMLCVQVPYCVPIHRALICISPEAASFTPKTLSVRSNAGYITTQVTFFTGRIAHVPPVVVLSCTICVRIVAAKVPELSHTLGKTASTDIKARSGNSYPPHMVQGDLFDTHIPVIAGEHEVVKG